VTAVIARDPERAAGSPWDLVVVGGGIQGAALAFEAARRGLAALLVERGDFGGETSWNSLRIVHGGLRHLQRLDLPGHRQSAAERRFLLSRFPDLVKPLPCLMPLWDPPRGGALRRPGPWRLALAADAALLPRRNAGLPEGQWLPRGRVLGPEEAAARVPGLDPEGLRGAALWHDAVVPDSHRLLVEMLRWACAAGAVAVNHVEAVALVTEGGRVAGVRALDRVSGRELELSARAVVNCAGPWCRELAGRFDRDLPELFRPTLAFNLFLDLRFPADAAVAVAAPGPNARTWFLLPWEGGTLAGTFYLPEGEVPAPGSGPEERHVESFLGELDAAWPGLGVRGARVLRVLAGRMPARSAGGPGRAEPSSRPVVVHHGRHGGPWGLVSVSGVKLTTARALAERALGAFPRDALRPGPPREVPRPANRGPLPWPAFVRLAERDWAAARRHLGALVAGESVVHLEDLLMRRTGWAIRPDRQAAAERLCEALGWREFLPPSLREEPRRVAEGGGGR
jgi:glycerol-3-phosphate dehydrogenase